MTPIGGTASVGKHHHPQPLPDNVRCGPYHPSISRARSAQSKRPLPAFPLPTHPSLLARHLTHLDKLERLTRNSLTSAILPFSFPATPPPATNDNENDNNTNGRNNKPDHPSCRHCLTCTYLTYLYIRIPRTDIVETLLPPFIVSVCSAHSVHGPRRAHDSAPSTVLLAIWRPWSTSSTPLPSVDISTVPFTPSPPLPTLGLPESGPPPAFRTRQTSKTQALALDRELAVEPAAAYIASKASAGSSCPTPSAAPLLIVHTINRSIQRPNTSL
ncbi:hypothetical protein F4780DRAFT_307027 [Xylariomycetidae sp. FL0641]|nr:hypothetical protein F4780DRAFT_307027 [Xylariomycetidae sp. FL0641]